MSIISKCFVCGEDFLTGHFCRAHKYDAAKIDWKARAEAAEKRVGELEGELETERLRLAACGVAAMCNTKETAAKQRIDRNNPYWSGSYGDVCSAVDREMQLREILVSLESSNAALRGALEIAYEKLKTLPWKGGASGPLWLTAVEKALSTSPPPAKFGRALHSEGQIQTPDKLSPATERQGKVEELINAVRAIYPKRDWLHHEYTPQTGIRLFNALIALEKEGGMK